jgi:hypothetical protein
MSGIKPYHADDLADELLTCLRDSIERILEVENLVVTEDIVDGDIQSLVYELVQAVTARIGESTEQIDLEG